jgi:putative ABC transport system substrate-binding protein
MVKEAEAAARGMGVQLHLVRAEAPNDLDGAFAAIARWRADAFLPLPSPMLFAERDRLVDLAARYRLPAMYLGREFVDLGGLMAYGPSCACGSSGGQRPIMAAYVSLTRPTDGAPAAGRG